MSKQSFEKLLDKRIKQKEENQIDWNKEKEEWLDLIETFYSQVKTWLQPFFDDGRMQINFSKKSITEENIGSYDVDIMELMFSGQKLFFEPIGTLLIGSKGRIDLISGRRSVKFILVDKDSTGIKIKVTIMDDHTENKFKESKEIVWTWKILNGSNFEYIDFTEDSFFNVLAELINE